jgi:hypothetical protein
MSMASVPKASNRSKILNRSQMSEDRGQKTEDRGQRSEDRGQSGFTPFSGHTKELTV